MKKFKSWDTAKTYTESEKLPAGGYVVKIMAASVEKASNGNEFLKVAFDIAEGEYAGYYARKYRAANEDNKKWKGNINLYIPLEDGSEQDEYTASKFKTAITNIEDSNPGYHWDWDEKKLKDKIVGCIFREKEYEYEGNTGFFAEPFRFATAENIRDGKFRMPKPKLLNNSSSTQPTFDNAADVDDDLPF